MRYLDFVLVLILIFLLPIFSFASPNCVADHTILVTNYSFTPSELTIAPGETVAFINVEGTHNINGITNTLTGEPFNNPTEFFLADIEGSAQGVLMGEITFDQTGTYNYDCSIGLHAQLGMVGKIIVDGFTIQDLLGAETIPNTFFPAYAFQFYTDSILDTDGPITLFLPDNGAVEDVISLMNLSQWDLLGMPDLPAIMRYHMADGAYLLEDLQAGMNLPTLYGQDLPIYEDGGVIKVGDGSNIIASYETDNGVVHVLDKVLAPDDLAEATVWDIINDSEDHTIFAQAIINSELKEMLRAQDDLDFNQELEGPFTVFAPTNAAFEAYAQSRQTTVAELITGQFVDDIVRTHIIRTKHGSTSFFGGQSLTNYLNENNQITIDGDNILVDNVPLAIVDLEGYNGFVHVLNEVIAPELPPVTGTCGTWTLKLEEEAGFFSLGWEGVFVDVVIDGEVISKETGLENVSISTFEFGVDIGADIDIVVNMDDTDMFSNFFATPALRYQVFDNNNELVFSAGDGGEIMTSVYGLSGCGTPPSCGFTEIQMFDAAPWLTDGWDFARLDVSINGSFYKTIRFVWGVFQQAYIPTENGDVLDFIYTAGAIPQENSYVVYHPDGSLIATQAASGEAPGNVLDLSVCAATNTNDPALLRSTSIFPNPTSDQLIIQSDLEILRVSITNMYGQIIYNGAYENEVLDVSYLEVGTYLLEVQTVRGLEAHKFSFLR